MLWTKFINSILIDFTKQMFPEITEPSAVTVIKSEPENNQDTKKKKSQFTVPRQLLAIRYLMKYAKIDTAITDTTKLIRLAQLITGREENKEAGNTNLYRQWNSLFKKDSNRRIQDLVFVKEYFEALELGEVVRFIENEIEEIKVSKKRKK